MKDEIIETELKWVQIERTYELDEDKILESMERYFYGEWRDEEGNRFSRDTIKKCLENPSQYYAYDGFGCEYSFQYILKDYMLFKWYDIKSKPEIYFPKMLTEKVIKTFELPSIYQTSYSINQERIIFDDDHSVMLCQNLNDIPHYDE